MRKELPKDLPEENARIWLLVDKISHGIIADFVRKLNEGYHTKEEKITDQNFGRIFRIEGKTKKYPSVPQLFIERILEKIKHVRKAWLLAGEDPMLNNEEGSNKPPFQKDEYTLLMEKHLKLKEEIESKSKTTVEKRLDGISKSLSFLLASYNSLEDELASALSAGDTFRHNVHKKTAGKLKDHDETGTPQQTDTSDTGVKKP
jgi:hypothetical protein